MQFRLGVLILVSGCSQPGSDIGTHNAHLGDFSGGVVAENHPEGAGRYGVFYDATHNTFGTPSAATLDGVPAMRIEDGGFTNGVYAIFERSIPADGTYRLEVPMLVVETSATTTDGVDQYQVGVATGAAAVHRGPNPSALAGLTTVGNYPALTDGDDTGLGTTTVSTGEFVAQAGDDLLLAFGTDVTTGAWNAGSGFWNGTYILVGSPRLVEVIVDPSIVVDNDDGPPGFTVDGSWSLSGSPGFNGGTYHFTSTGNGATARFRTSLAPGFYEAETIYRAGTNRTGNAHYSVNIGGTMQVERVVDQRYRNLSWVGLGLIHVEAPSEATIEVDAPAGAPGEVLIADAVRFMPVDGPPPEDPPEIRLAAITVFDPLSDPGAVQAIVDDLEALHYNAVAVHARYRGDATYLPNRNDATYPNNEPRSPLVGEVDVLAEMVERGHRAGLKVFAYVNTHLVTDGADSVASPNHVVNVHPEWRTYAYNGGAPVVQNTSHDPEGLWLDPALPEVRSYLADIAGDIATNYDIDGVILDRIRYPQTSFTRENRDFGYHPEAIRRFNRRYFRWGTPDPRDERWIAFRQEAVTANVGAIHDRLAAIDPELLLYAYPIGRFNDAIEFNYQDWPEWLRRHRIDGVLPQVYSTDQGSFEDRLLIHRNAYDGDRMLGVTLNGFQPGVDLFAQVEGARAAGFAGSSPFRHGTLGPLGYLEPLAEGWDGIAPFPEHPWKGQSQERLRFRADCGGQGGHAFEIRNENEESIAYDWWSLGQSSGSGYAAVGESTLTIPRTRSFELVFLRWYGYDGEPRYRFTLSCLRRSRSFH
ncbi:MAG: family 10 glycosylhydrolase [Myxococcota bacterium]